MSGVLNVLLGLSGAPGAINGALPNGGGAGSASFSLLNDGTYVISGVSNANWVDPAVAAVAAYYEVMVEVTAGPGLTGSATGSYLSLGTTRSWSTTGTVEFTVSFREIASGVVRSVQAGKTLTVA